MLQYYKQILKLSISLKIKNSVNKYIIVHQIMLHDLLLWTEETFADDDISSKIQNFDWVI